MSDLTKRVAKLPLVINGKMPWELTFPNVGRKSITFDFESFDYEESQRLFWIFPAQRECIIWASIASLYLDGWLCTGSCEGLGLLPNEDPSDFHCFFITKSGKIIDPANYLADQRSIYIKQDHWSGPWYPNFRYPAKSFLPENPEEIKSIMKSLNNFNLLNE